ncbi:heme exporter protein CcmD [Microvirga tunisiensis]|uniref:Heme exporter protein D n=1 Tax=Pannonibacter tanglangensis TaxID=2750084 RepID=A0A7X5F5W0_9HYPH|nr:heme exporter protein CcmD [Pannonibacter sp. XCT-53]NBN80278.1 heme exporter protein CcmD [Pannonibacter sp. XCT-53]
MDLIAFLDLGPHAAFIIWSYLICLAVVIGLIAWVRLDHARQVADLAGLEAQGITRRSGAATGSGATVATGSPAAPDPRG